MTLANVGASHRHECNWVHNVIKKVPEDDNRREEREVAIFSDFDTIGFEEILHNNILDRLRAEKQAAKE